MHVADFLDLQSSFKASCISKMRDTSDRYLTSERKK